MNTPNRNNNAKFFTPAMAAEQLNLCRGTVIRLSKEAKALIRIGRTMRIDMQKLLEYLIENYSEE